MAPRLHTWIFASAWLLLASCGSSERYEQRTRTLDSLGGALNNMTSELRKPDSIFLSRLVAGYNSYSHFIGQNLRDTVDKSTADQVQRFYRSGKALQLFLENRPAILARAALIQSQQEKLAADIRKRAVPLNELDLYVAEEKEETGRLIAAGSQQQQAYFRGLEEYRLALPEVEKLIRSCNEGQLPTIIRDSLPF